MASVRRDDMAISGLSVSLAAGLVGRSVFLFPLFKTKKKNFQFN